MRGNPVRRCGANAHHDRTCGTVSHHDISVTVAGTIATVTIAITLSIRQ